MKKLLLINGHLNTGGVEKSLLDLLRHLDYEEYEVDLLLLEELGDYGQELPGQVHVRLRCLKNTYGSVLSSLLRCVRQGDWFCFRMRLIFLLMKLFGQKKIGLARKLLTGGKHYDCAIGFRPGICTQIAAFAADADRRITWWHHGEFNVDRNAYEAMCGKMDCIAVVSDSCCQMIAERCPTLREKLVCVPNMLDIGTIEGKAGGSPYQGGRFHIVSVGRLAPEKHFENAVFAANKLLESGIDNFEWHIVGGGADRESLENAVAEYNLAGYVVLEGNRSNPYPYMKYADLYVHPSYVESQGLTILEAMALGVPCVVTKSRGPCEFIEDGVNGILTEQSPESLAEQVLRILRDRELYERIKANTRCPECFEPEHVMRAIENLLGDGIDGTGQSS